MAGHRGKEAVGREEHVEKLKRIKIGRRDSREGESGDTHGCRGGWRNKAQVKEKVMGLDSEDGTASI